MGNGKAPAGARTALTSPCLHSGMLASLSETARRTLLLEAHAASNYSMAQYMLSRHDVSAGIIRFAYRLGILDMDHVANTTADNPNMPPDVLEALSTRGFRTRYKVARHPNTTRDVLRALGSDREYLVQHEVAANSHTPDDVLVELALSTRPTIVFSVLNNPSSSERTVHLALNNRHILDEFWVGRIRGSGDSRSLFLMRMLDHPSPQVRDSVCQLSRVSDHLRAAMALASSN